jgi:wyosine [tRNA(Phe)-imidazoG37] synthetase (radical SAM superfamily)
MSAFLALKSGIIYGPVSSRRFGMSRGINLSPTKRKLCSMNCVYCQYGPTEILQATAKDAELPKLSDVIWSLEQVLKQDTHLDQITFSGNGEPTMHPEFPDMVEWAIQLRNRFMPKAKVAVLSNGTMLGNADVRTACDKLDRCVIKVDCGRAETFLRYNRPAKGITLESVLDGAKQLKRFYTETLLTAGRGGNSNPDERAAWTEIIKELKPVEAHIYSIDRPPAVGTLKLVSREMMNKWAREATDTTGVTVKAF